jgi:glycosyltransferase involved in cell wall biosynthesis
MTDRSSPFVSVIIPVFNDGECLKICLGALENQTYPKHLYKIIIVDNGSDETQNIQGIIAQFKQATAAIESTPGSYAARNHGISLAKGEVIAFTDADCIPATDWIEKGVKHLLAVSNCGLVAGKVEFFFQNPQQPTAVELYDSFMCLRQKYYVQERKFGATANLFTFKSVIDRVGVFDANLKSSGDAEWGRRVFSSGYQQVYAEDACVLHPARHSFKQLYAKAVRLAGGKYDLENKKNDSLISKNFTFAINLIKDLTPPVLWIYSIFKDDNIHKWQQKSKISIAIVFVRYVTAWEKIRLKAGKTSARK